MKLRMFLFRSHRGLTEFVSKIVLGWLHFPENLGRWRFVVRVALSGSPGSAKTNS